jgi:hypothetical protein
MSTNTHGAGGSYAITAAGERNLVARTLSQEEAETKAKVPAQTAAASKPAGMAPADSTTAAVLVDDSKQSGVKKN